MFKKIVIVLNDAICNCGIRNLAWCVLFDENKRPILRIACKLCHTGILVPHEKFVAEFEKSSSVASGENTVEDDRVIAEKDLEFLKELRISVEGDSEGTAE